MADTVIRNLVEKTTLALTDEMHINDKASSIDKKISVETLKNKMAGSMNRGYNGISLTNFTNTTIPQVSGGSSYEIDSSGDSVVYLVSGSTTITGLAGLAFPNDVFIYSDTSGNLSASLTSPSWDTTKQGWYNSNDRAIAGLYKVDNSTYTQKWVYSNNGLKIFQSNDRLVTVPAYMELEYVIGSGSQAVSTSWTKMVYNATVVNRITGASETTGVVTLPQGRYRINFITKVYGTNANILGRLRNTTTTTTIITGTTSFFSVATFDLLNDTLHGEFTLNGTSNLEIQYYATSASVAAVGLTVGGELSRAIVLQIWKIG